MNESYAETSVKRQGTIGTLLFKVALVVFCVLLVVIASMTDSPIIMGIGAIIVVAVFYLMPRLNVEYEYIFVDGQFDVDKIMGGSKRKNILRFDFEKVDVVAPQGSHGLDPYGNLKEKNFTSRNGEVTPYVIVVNEVNQKIKVLFEPSEKMLEVMKNKAPRKIMTF